MKLDELDTKLREAVIKLDRLMQSVADNGGCEKCTMYRPQMGAGPASCTKWEAPIPHESIKSGCTSWTYDDIPF